MTSICQVEESEATAIEKPICIGGMPCQFVSFQGELPDETTVTEIGCMLLLTTYVRSSLNFRRFT